MAPDDKDGGSVDERSRGNGSKMSFILIMLALLAVLSVGQHVVPMMKLKSSVPVLDSIPYRISILESSAGRVLI